MKTIFIIFLILHGIIHSAGFINAFYPVPAKELKHNISRANGILWLTATLLFLFTAVLLVLRNDYWWLFSAIAIIISQYLILANWSKARLGTIANFILLIVTVAGYGTWSYYKKYKVEAAGYLMQVPAEQELLTEADISHLPPVVQKYLHYTRSVNKPKIRNFKVLLTGRIRKNETSDWMPFSCEQYSFIAPSVRLFFMKATMKRLPVAGFHSFKNGNAFMDIRLLSLFRVQYEAGREMSISETVTFFNDMCCMAPATLIDKRVSWTDADSGKAKASFTNNGITIQAWLYFNDKGQLINFISDDRFAETDKGLKRYRWFTPLKDYKEFNGYRLASYADVVYQFPEGELCYGNFRIENIGYNNKE